MTRKLWVWLVTGGLAMEVGQPRLFIMKYFQGPEGRGLFTAHAHNAAHVALALRCCKFEWTKVSALHA